MGPIEPLQTVSVTDVSAILRRARVATRTQRAADAEENTTSARPDAPFGPVETSLRAARALDGRPALGVYGAFAICLDVVSFRSIVSGWERGSRFGP
jgi:hypothetical protein